MRDLRLLKKIISEVIDMRRKLHPNVIDLTIKPQQPNVIDLRKKQLHPNVIDLRRKPLQTEPLMYQNT